MFNQEKLFDEESKRIIVDIPLTTHTGKIRIKSRSIFYEYGQPHAAGSKPLHQTITLNGK